MSCYDCKYYTGERALLCAVDPITATSSPEEGCRDWQPAPKPKREVDIHTVGVGIAITYVIVLLGLAQWNNYSNCYNCRPGSGEIRLNK